ncbi:hypothetical protein BDR26DRAFT_300230 [Obelidium mucronatum]|nr:hypothetical protein BDR26DRAFT_300230 [Obelidium mucronatum]
MTEPPTPPSLTLKQLLIVHRHGERVPVRHVERIHQPGSHAFNLLWNQCSVPPFITALHEFRQSFEPALPQSAFGFLSRFAHAPHYPPIIGELKILQGDRDELPPYLFSRSSRLQLDTKTKDSILANSRTRENKPSSLSATLSVKNTLTLSTSFPPFSPRTSLHIISTCAPRGTFAQSSRCNIFLEACSRSKRVNWDSKSRST